MNRFDLVLRGGTVVTASDRFPADIGVRDGRIVALGDTLDRDAEHRNGRHRERQSENGRYRGPGEMTRNRRNGRLTVRRSKPVDLPRRTGRWAPFP